MTEAVVERTESLVPEDPILNCSISTEVIFLGASIYSLYYPGGGRTHISFGTGRGQKTTFKSCFSPSLRFCLGPREGTQVVRHIWEAHAPAKPSCWPSFFMF